PCTFLRANHCPLQLNDSCHLWAVAVSAMGVRAPPGSAAAEQELAILNVAIQNRFLQETGFAYCARRAYRFRSDSFRYTFRSRIDFGVTSTNSSSSMYSSAISRVICRGGLRRIVFSAVDARMLVSFFSRQALTGRSLSRQCSPTIWPS